MRTQEIRVSNSFGLSQKQTSGSFELPDPYSFGQQLHQEERRHEKSSKRCSFTDGGRKGYIISESGEKKELLSE